LLWACVGLENGILHPVKRRDETVMRAISQVTLIFLRFFILIIVGKPLKNCKTAENMIE
jgi:hypothetical protein